MCSGQSPEMGTADPRSGLFGSLGGSGVRAGDVPMWGSGPQTRGPSGLHLTPVLLTPICWSGWQALCVHLPKPGLNFSFLCLFPASGGWTKKGHDVPLARKCLFPNIRVFLFMLSSQREHPQGSQPRCSAQPGLPRPHPCPSGSGSFRLLICRCSLAGVPRYEPHLSCCPMPATVGAR